MTDRPLHEYIDLEAYGVVTQESYDALKARVAELEAALRSIQAVAVMSHSERARTHRLDWLREIEDRARAALAGDGGGA